MLRPIPFATQSYQSASLPLSAQRCVNAYAEMQPPNAKVQVATFQCPGIEQVVECGTGPVRGLHEFDGLLYAVSGHQFYRIDHAGTAVLLGSAIGGSGRVSITDNGTQICLVTGESGYIYSNSLGFTPISDVDFHPARTVTYFDGYFVFDWVDTNKFFISSVLDGTDFSALDFASAEVSPDKVLSVARRQDNVVVIGSNSIELMYNDPIQDFPLIRIGGGLVERGCAAPLAVTKEDNALFLLGDDLVFYRLDGIAPKRISTHAIEAAWRGYETVSDAFCDAITHNGHKFIYLTFPTALATWGYDISTGLWHERTSWDSSNRSMGRWCVNAHAFCYGHNYVGDYLTGKIGKLSSTTYTEFGNVMPVEMVGPPLHSNGNRVFINSIEIDIETGVGLTTGQGSDPQVMLQSSDDGGRTWNSPQLFRSMGAIGEYRKRVFWRREGSSYQRVYRLTKTDPVKLVVIAANADIEVGT